MLEQPFSHWIQTKTRPLTLILTTVTVKTRKETKRTVVIIESVPFHN